MIRKRYVIGFFIIFMGLSSLLVLLKVIDLSLVNTETRLDALVNDIDKRFSNVDSEFDVMMNFLEYSDFTTWMDQETDNPLLSMDKHYTGAFVVLNQEKMMTGNHYRPKYSLDELEQNPWFQQLQLSSSRQVFTSFNTSGIENDHVILGKTFYNKQMDVEGILCVEVDLVAMMKEMNVDLKLDTTDLFVYDKSGNILFNEDFINSSKPKFMDVFQNVKKVPLLGERFNYLKGSYLGTTYLLIEEEVVDYDLNVLRIINWPHLLIQYVLFGTLQLLVIVIMTYFVNKGYDKWYITKALKKKLNIKEEAIVDKIDKDLSEANYFRESVKEYFGIELYVIAKSIKSYLMKLDIDENDDDYKSIITISDYLEFKTDYVYDSLRDASIKVKPHLDMVNPSEYFDKMNHYIDLFASHVSCKVIVAVNRLNQQLIVTYPNALLMFSLKLIYELIESNVELHINFDQHPNAIMVRIRSKEDLNYDSEEVELVKNSVVTKYGGMVNYNNKELRLMWPLIVSETKEEISLRQKHYRHCKLLGYKLTKASEIILQNASEDLGYQFEMIQNDVEQKISNDYVIFDYPKLKGVMPAEITKFAHKIMIIDEDKYEFRVMVDQLNCDGYLIKPITKQKIAQLLEILDKRNR